jgi:hypothetical protein
MTWDAVDQGFDCMLIKPVQGQVQQMTFNLQHGCQILFDIPHSIINSPRTYDNCSGQLPCLTW